MKYLKTYKVFESSNDNSKLIKELDDYAVENYTINDDGTIDVRGCVYFNSLDFKKIPFRFGKVTGNFVCFNSNLTSLEGSPKEVGGNFNCRHNNLKDLIGGPQEVGGEYRCSNNELETLEGIAGDIGEDLYCSNNKLTSLDCSSVINGDIYCTGNNFKEEPEFFGICGGKIYWKD